MKYRIKCRGTRIAAQKCHFRYRTTHLLVVAGHQLLVEDDREQVKMNGLQINGAAILLLLFHND